MICIRGLNKAEVLYALYHKSTVRGMGFLHARRELSLDACRELMDFWWLSDPSKEALSDKLIGLVDKRVNGANEMLQKAMGVNTDDELLDVWQECIDTLPVGRNVYFDYLYGRVLKVDLSSDYLDERLYDRDNGPGAAQQAVDSVRYK